MISVQNHRQLLNGSKIIFVLVGIFLFSSCGIFSGSSKKRSGHSKRRPPVHKKKKIEKEDKVDSLQWPDNTPDEDNVNLHGTVIKNSYTIDLLIPFEANRHFEDINALEKSMSNRFLHYYSGVLMALKELEKKNGNFAVNVFDTPLKNDRIPYLKSKMNQDPPDIIIGPYDKNQLKSIANYGKRKQINIISPWKSISSIGNDNPYYIQLKPSLENYFGALVKNVDKNFDPENVYLIGRDIYKDKARMKKVNKIHKQLNEDIKDYNILIVNKDSLEQEGSLYDSIFKEKSYKDKVFIIPNWSYKDEAFIYSCLRKLNIEKGEKRVYVYGMPILLKSNKIGYNFFKRLNIRVASPKYIDDNNPKVKKFKYDYYKRFNVFPLDDAFEGYDMMMFVGENMMQYGTKFQYFVENKNFNMLVNSINLLRNVKEEDIRNEELDKINYFENTDLFIVGFKFNKFEKIN